MSEIKDALLKEILNSMKDENGVILFEASDSLVFQRHLSLLSSIIASDINFEKKLNYLRFHLTSKNNSFLWNELVDLLFELKKEQKFSYADFDLKLKNYFDSLNKQKIKKFELYYPLNIKFIQEISDIHFKDVHIELKKYDEIKVIFEDERVKKYFYPKEKFSKEKYSYIKVTIFARNTSFAIDVSTKYINLLLGFISLAQKYQTNSITSMGIPKALSVLKLNYSFPFMDGTTAGIYFFDDTSDATHFYELSKEDAEFLNKLLNKFNNANANVQNIISNSINFYYSGLAEAKISYSFLNFWTALEILTLKGKKKHVEIMLRLKSILIGLTLLDEYKMNRIYSLRNNLVHGGNLIDVSQFDRNLLKAYVENLLEFFIFNLAIYNPSEINTIYDFLQKDDITLEKSKKLIDFVVNLRNQGEKNV